VTCPPDHKHALTLTCYHVHRCRCTPCSEHATAANRHRERLKLYGRYESPYVDSKGTHRRLQALAVKGWSLAMIADRLGRTRQTLQRTMQRTRTTAEVAELVARVFDELWDVDPVPTTVPERIGIARTRGWAKRQGWLPALAWDDIDNDPDPAAVIERCKMGHLLTGANVSQSKKCASCRPNRTVAESDAVYRTLVPGDDPDVGAVDMEAVNQALGQWPTMLNYRELREFIRRGAGQGLTDSEMAEISKVSMRTIERHRQDLGIVPSAWEERDAIRAERGLPMLFSGSHLSGNKNALRKTA
jgi:lambda repressor-like predicted transcriptional regulator